MKFVLIVPLLATLVVAAQQQIHFLRSVVAPSYSAPTTATKRSIDALGGLGLSNLRSISSLGGSSGFGGYSGGQSFSRPGGSNLLQTLAGPGLIQFHGDQVVSESEFFQGGNNLLGGGQQFLSSGSPLFKGDLSGSSSFSGGRYGRYKAPIPRGPCGPGLARNALGQCTQARVSNNVFLFKAPRRPPPPVRPAVVPEPKIHYNYVYVHSTDTIQGPDPIVVPPAQEKTVVYVLNKQPQPINQEVIQVNNEPADPEVFFVNYNEGQNPQLPGGIDLQTALSQSARLGGRDSSQEQLLAGGGGGFVSSGLGGAFGGSVSGGGSYGSPIIFNGDLAAGGGHGYGGGSGLVGGYGGGGGVVVGGFAGGHGGGFVDSGFSPRELGDSGEGGRYASGLGISGGSSSVLSAVGGQIGAVRGYGSDLQNSEGGSSFASSSSGSFVGDDSFESQRSGSSGGGGQYQDLKKSASSPAQRDVVYKLKPDQIIDLEAAASAPEQDAAGSDRDQDQALGEESEQYQEPVGSHSQPRLSIVSPEIKESTVSIPVFSAQELGELIGESAVSEDDAN